MTQARFYYFVVLVLLFHSWGGWSAIDRELPNELKPIDDLQASLQKNYKSKTASLIRQSYEAFLRKKYAVAIQLATKVQRDETFSDFGYWLAASAFREQAAQNLVKKQYSPALQAAKKATSLSLLIESKNPYSPFLKTLQKEVAQAEFLAANSLWGTHQWSASAQSFESAFQRMQLQNSLSLLNPIDIERYAQACKNRSTPLCDSWMKRILSVTTKATSESIIRLFPKYSDLPKPPRFSGKSTVPYKAPDLDQAAFESAMKAYFDERFSDAIKNFEKFLDDFPRSAYRFRARYWLAQSLSQKKDHEKALKVYEQLQVETPLSYYGFLASHVTGKPIDSSIEAALPLASESDPSLLPSEAFHLKRAQHLIAEKAYPLASFELKDLRARDALTSPFLVYLTMLNYKAQNYTTEFALIGELIQRNYEGIVSSFGLRMIFPQPFSELIHQIATEASLDPILVMSLIKQESAFAEDANSSVGAMGLMQLMPMTAFDTEPLVKTPELLSAATNIRVGTKYLKKLLARYNGNIVLALASYNAGPTAVDRWIKENLPKKSMLEFIESIPYKETREYVGSIIRNYFWYSRQLNGEFKKDLNYFWNTYPPENNLKPSQKTLFKQQNGNA